MAAKKFAVTTEYINEPDQSEIITMIRERIERLKTWAKASIAAVKAKIAVAVEKMASLFEAGHQIAADLVIVIANPPDAGKCLKVSGGHAHAPFFSLYTFFKN